MDNPRSKNSANLTTRPAISRRSCNQCRARKIRCDRGSPCGNCNSAKLVCTHSTVTSNAGPPRQRILVSAQYEEKIDEIAKGINDIQLLLQGPQVSHLAMESQDKAAWSSDKIDMIKLTMQDWSNTSASQKSQDDCSMHITGFVRNIVKDESLKIVSKEACQTISSLEKFLHMLDNPKPAYKAVPLSTTNATGFVDQRLPPMEPALAVLRWAKTHHSCGRVFWLSHILPQEMFIEICRKVYFAVDDYDQIDLALASGYLSYIFAEHAIEPESSRSQEYSDLCRVNLHSILLQLPLLLQPSLETVAALTIGTFHAIENSAASMAWTYISTALNLCQTLGYHRVPEFVDADISSRAVQVHLFWTVYRCERAMALRMNRCSNIRDDEITIGAGPADAYYSKIGRIQGQIYDQLYSPTTRQQATYQQRRLVVEDLAGEMREIITDVDKEISVRSQQSKPNAHDTPNYSRIQVSACLEEDCKVNMMQVLYPQLDLMCHYSSLALILRAIPPLPHAPCNVSDESVTVSRHALRTHELFMNSLRSSGVDATFINKYIAWAIINSPFVPFSILFTRVIQVFDTEDLELLERFAASLKFDSNESGAEKHPTQLYELLCRAARLYIGQSNMVEDVNSTWTGGGAFSHIYTPDTLSDWYRESQQVMSLLDEDFIF